MSKEGSSSNSFSLSDIVIAETSKVPHERVIEELRNAWNQRDQAVAERDRLINQHDTLHRACSVITTTCELLHADNDRLRTRILSRGLTDIIQDTWNTGVDGKALIITIFSIFVLYIPGLCVSIADLVISIIALG